MNKEEFEVIKQIGKGSYSKVFLAKQVSSNNLVALKVFSEECNINGLNPNIVREMANSQLSDKTHILAPLTFFTREKQIVAVYEYFKHDLHNLIYTNSFFPVMNINTNKGERNSPILTSVVEKENLLGLEGVKSVMKQLLKALLVLHKNKIIHRDLKPANILINVGDAIEGLLVKVGDLGLSLSLAVSTGKKRCDVCTLHYRPPEVLMEKDYGLGFDIWSLGCTFAEMVVGKVLLEGENVKEQLILIFKMNFFLNDPEEQAVQPSSDNNEESNNIDIKKITQLKNRVNSFKKIAGPLGIGFLQKMLKMNPAQRSTLEELIIDPFLYN